MRKNKISRRLIVYFCISILLFSLATGIVYAINIRKFSQELHRTSMLDRANRISETMSQYLEETQNVPNDTVHGRGSGRNMHSHNMMSGYGRYLSFIEDIAMGDVWLIDSEQNLITRGDNKQAINPNDLPLEARQVISSAITGETTFSESFSDTLGQESLSIGVPIKDDDGQILGAVLVHSPVNGLSEVRDMQLKTIAISIGVALLITVPIIIIFSLKFTKPLKKMRNVSQQLSDGDYLVKTNVNQNDEIGELASSIDTLSQRLQEAKLSQEESEQMRQVFFSNISHELRTPVTVMRGSLEALNDGVIEDEDKIKEYYQQMLNESIHLQRLVNDLLELSRLQNQDFDIEKTEINISEIIHDISRSMRSIADTKNISIELNIDEYIPYFGDYSRLRQMFIIPIENAIKFSNEDSTIIIQQSSLNNKQCISIIDHGVGIASELLPHIFERFYHETSETNKNGSGLGLPISKAIATRHNIEIEVVSQPNYTEFKYILNEK